MKYSLQRRVTVKGAKQFKHSQFLKPSEIKLVKDIQEVYEKKEMLIKIDSKLFAHVVDSYVSPTSLEAFIKHKKLYVLWK